MNNSSADSFYFENSIIAWDPQVEGLEIRDGTKIDASSLYWWIPTPSGPKSIDLRKLQLKEGDHFNSIRLWVAHNLRYKSVSLAINAYSQALPFFNSPAFIQAAEAGNEVPFLAFSQGQLELKKHQLFQRHSFRDFYKWCHSQQFPIFSTDVVCQLDAIVIGGNSKGQAVRSLDPEKGPLDAMEVAAISSALRAARVEGSMPIAEQAALWLCLAFGANASQASLMREEDVRPETVNGQIATTLISVPRHKKGFAKAREAFQTRKANRFVGRVLRELIEENERIHPKGVVSEPRPLFRRAKARADVKGMEEWEDCATSCLEILERAGHASWHSHLM